jgi:Ca-activated chloride channel family protein
MSESPDPIDRPTTAPGRRRAGGRRGRTTAALVALALVAAACAGGSEDARGQDEGSLGDPGDCLVVDLAASPEKIDLLTDLAKAFNAQDRQVGDRCVFVAPRTKSSGAAMDLLAEGWDEAAEGPRPVIWSPAGSSWGAILDQRLAEEGAEPMAGTGTPFMNTPLVIAMPEPMAEALGHPQEALGWSDVLELARDPEGWAAHGHPEWGPFRLGKTNPNFSTSGLSALIAQTYAATGKTRDLSREDLADPAVVDYGTTIESAVVHYGDTTMTFLNNWYRADQRGTSLTYASAVAIEEKSLIDYNQGNPDGILDAGEEPRAPRVPLVAIYPEEGTIFSDNPFFVLDAEWVDDDEREAAMAFGDFVQEPENQQRVLEFGFRPGNPEVALGEPIVAANGVDPDQPQTLLQIPSPPVMVSLLETWATQRKAARVLLVVDVSGSMSDLADPETGETKLDLAKRAAIDSLDQFKPEDEVGLRIFSTGLGPEGTDNYTDVLPLAPISAQGEQMRSEIQRLFPTNGTPLYDVTGAAFATVAEGYDPSRINAVVVLTDGMNDDGIPGDDRTQLDRLLADLEGSTQGENAQPVRVFTIGYGEDADLSVLRRMAEATNAAAYNASDPKTIEKVFTAVVSNF